MSQPYFPINGVVKRIASRSAQRGDTRRLEQELNQLEADIKNRESHYYSAQEAIADGPLVQKLYRQTQDIRKELLSLGWLPPIRDLRPLHRTVEEFLEEQIGMEDDVQVNVDNEGIWITCPRLRGDAEDQEMGAELIDLLDRDFSLKYTIQPFSKGIALKRIAKRRAAQAEEPLCRSCGKESVENERDKCPTCAEEDRADSIRNLQNDQDDQ